MGKDIVTDICVIGAGPCGLLAAILARLRGFDVTIIDKKNKNEVESNAHYLNAYSLEILSKIGLDVESLKTKATPINASSKMVYCFDLHNCFASCDSCKEDKDIDIYKNTSVFPSFLNVPMANIIPDMIEIAKSLQVNFLWSHVLETIDDVSAKVGCRVVNSEDIVFIKSNWIVACDGANSTSAKILDMGYQNKSFLQDFVSVSIKSDISKYVAKEAILYWIYNPEIRCCLVAHDLKKYQVLQIPIFPPFDNIEDYTKESILKKIACICREDPKNMKVDIGKITHWKMMSQSLINFRKNRVFFAGDSAHVTFPAGGLGLNAGFFDVYNLIWKLSEYENKEDSKYLDSYHDERYVLATKNVKDSVENYKDFLNVPKSLGIDPKISGTYSFVDTIFFKNNIFFSSCLSLGECVNYYLDKNFKYNYFDLIKWAKVKSEKAVIGNLKHFNGYNQHLNFSIKGCLIYKNDFILNKVSFPFNLGERCPHFYIQDKGKKVSLFSFLSYDKWLGLIFKKESAWEKKLQVYNKKLNLITIGTNKLFKEDGSEVVLPTCDNFVLIRPDGIISFSDSYTKDNSVNFFVFFDYLLKD